MWQGKQIVLLDKNSKHAPVTKLVGEAEEGRQQLQPKRNLTRELTFISFFFVLYIQLKCTNMYVFANFIFVYTL